MTTVIGAKDNRMNVARPIIGDVEKVADFFDEHVFAFFLRDVFADDNHAIFLAARVGTVAELRHLFAVEAKRHVAALADDAVLDVGGLVAQAGHGLIAGRARQLLPGIGRQFAGHVFEIAAGVVAEDEGNETQRVPAIEVLGLGKVRIAAEEHLAKAAQKASADSGIKRVGGAFMGGTIAAAINDAQGFAGIGQGNHEGVITPGAVIGDIHALFALAGCGNQRAVGIDDCLLEKGCGLMFPDADANVVINVLQGIDVGDSEPSAKIARGGGIGNTLSAEGVEEVGIVAAQFDVLQTIAAA